MPEPAAGIADTQRRRIDIGLLWHSLSSGNLGVGALTFANMAIARDVALAEGYEPRFTVIGMRDGDAAIGAMADVGNFVIDTRSMLLPGGYWSAVRRLDCVLDIGAGDSFAEIYGPKRFGFLWLTKLMAELRGVPLLLSPQTIGPFTKSIYRRLAAMTMRRAHAVIARDKVSLALAQEMAPGTPAILSADVAFELPYESQAQLRGGERLRIGVNASGLLFHEAETGRNRFGLSLDYARFIRALIAALIARGDEVHLISHATSTGDPTDDDGRRADLLAGEFPQAIRVPDFATPMAAKSYISGLDFLTAGRMHACIGAYSAGTPVVPIAYSRKFVGLFGMLEYDWTVPVTGMDTDQAVAFVLSAIDQRATLATDAARGMTKVTGLLDQYRAALRELFAVAAKKRA